MKNVIFQLCTKLAACAFLAAMVSVGTASCNGLYQPEVPQQLKR
ncbi:cyclic lactone autoinducer peptide [Butyricicoccus faecihominis]|nr:cyclic lactone autoinducer peptide [Butyricicoccus faecihominis]MCQ5128590.1 cyclic lactone autoinducer peptide [Butyricicoccus faecihominis]